MKTWPEIAAELKRYRKQRKVLQKTIADGAGISKSYYCLIESGKSVPSLQTLLYIFMVLSLEIKIIDLFNEQNDS